MTSTSTSIDSQTMADKVERLQRQNQAEQEKKQPVDFAKLFEMFQASQAEKQKEELNRTPQI